MPAIVVLTGAASGIGRALAQAMAGRGDTVVAVDVDPAVHDVATTLTARGPGSVHGAVLDVRDADAVADVVAGTRDRFGRLDLMLNNAGIGIGGPVEELTAAHWDRVIDVNVRGVVHGVQAAYPLMVEQGSGHIVNTASLAGLVPSPMLAPYALTKHAVVGLSLSLRLEAAGHGVRVSALCPGVVDTPILDKGTPDDLPPLRHDLSARELLSRVNRPYPVDALARDALRGIARNRALIVTPRSARVAWWLDRVAPALVARVGREQVAWARARVGARSG